MIQNEKDFFSWIDGQLDEEIPPQIIAFSINIYESPFNIEIVGSTEFDPENEDWACNENWISKQRRVPVSSSLFGGSWEEAQENLIAMAKAYLHSSSKNASKLTASKAFAIGFVDGNLTYVQ